MSSLSEVVTDALSAIGAPLLTDLMLLLLLAIFILAVVLRLRNQATAFTNYVPTLLTIVGLLGTFSGILVGLLEFNIQKVDGSIGALLAGLKTAFIASLTGILLSIIYKTLISTELLKPRPQFLPENAPVSDETAIPAILQAQLMAQEQIKALAQQQVQALLQLNERLHGFESRLDQRLIQLAQTVSQMAVQQVSEALETVVTDFNQHIHQQFGEQFGHLDHAIGDLVTWQTEHKHQLVAMQEQYLLGIKQISLLQTTLQQAHHFWQDSLTGFEQVPNHLTQLLTQLSAVIGINQQQIQQIDAQFSQLADIHDQAHQAVPAITELMNNTLDQLNHTTQNVVNGLQTSAQQIQEHLTTIASDVSELQHQTYDTLQSQMQQTQQLMQELFTQQVTSMDSAMHTHLEQIISELGRSTPHASKAIPAQLRQETRTPPLNKPVPGAVTDPSQVPLSTQTQAGNGLLHSRHKKH